MLLYIVIIRLEQFQLEYFKILIFKNNDSALFYSPNSKINFSYYSLITKIDFVRNRKSFRMLLH